MRPRIEKLTIKGFKTIRELKDFDLKPLTILIGANGAGKSNFISFFKIMAHVMHEQLGLYVAKYAAGASNLLFDGKRTSPFEGAISINDGEWHNEYFFTLVFAANDTLVFGKEGYCYSTLNYDSKPLTWANGAVESNFAKYANESTPTSATDMKAAYKTYQLIQKIWVRQFHNTSFTSGIRAKSDISKTLYLEDEGANLPAFLYGLKTRQPQYYQRIVETTRLILPFFYDYVLEPEGQGILLRWKEKNSDMLFSANMAADGMLRTMALVALLLQPEASLPDVLIIDEPELGLHPYAIEILGGLLKGASKLIQVIIATQSAQLIDCFEPEDVVVVERKNRESTFTRLSGTKLEGWLEDYSLSELWRKNVIGGRPQ